MMNGDAATIEGAHGLAAEFGKADSLLSAARRAHQAGYRRMDAYSPFPVDGLSEAIGFTERRLPKIMFAGGVVGAVLGFGLQVYAKVDYPLNVGGRPNIAVEPLMLVTFELLVLFAVLFLILAMIALNRLPRLHHPIFGLDRFHLASQDRFFLFISASDDRYDDETTRAFLESLSPARVDAVAGEPAP